MSRVDGAILSPKPNSSFALPQTKRGSKPFSVPSTIRSLLIAVLLAPFSCCSYAQGRITVDADPTHSVAIAPQLMGVNDMWYFVPGSSFDSFTSSLIKNAGVRTMRFPGGFEAEWYDWSNNTVDQAYRNHPEKPGASPEQVIRAFGPHQEGFVVRTKDALQAADPRAYQQWADVASQLVNAYSGQVSDWAIGNEWYNIGGAAKNYDEFLRRYAQLVRFYVPAMKAAAKKANHEIHIYVTVNICHPTDMTTFPKLVGSVWSQVDGLDLHIYSGETPGGGGNSPHYPHPPINQIEPTISFIKSKAPEKLLWVSEWAATLNDNHVDGKAAGGLQNANYMMELFGHLAHSGVGIGSYWPPVMANRVPQADTITLVPNNPSYTPIDADGQAFHWLSADYVGRSLPEPKVEHSSVKSIAAADGHRIVVFVMTGPTAMKETETIHVVGAHWSTVTSAEALYQTGDAVRMGPALTSDIASSVHVGPDHSITVQVNPESPNRGTQWEIIRIVLN